MSHLTDPFDSPDATPRPDAGATDYADMGTAFGLDASFACDPALRIGPDVGEARDLPPWEHRLTRRSGL